jgi:molybdate/tungstate transport system substrate-binding protein
MARRRRAVRAVTATLVAGILAAACGSPASTGPTSTGPAGNAGSARVSGTADVAYAGSLQLLNDTVLGPAFAKSTGAAYEGRGAGALGLSKEIASGEITPNVFESIGSAPITALEPRFTTWYVQVAASPLVVAYNPDSPDGPELSRIAKGARPLSDLFTLMASPGFLLGRTDPSTDPQGQAFYEMVELAQTVLHLPPGTAGKVLGPPSNPAQIFAETALESRLEAGQLDAASAFLSQAVQLHLHYIALPATIDFGDPSLAGAYAKAHVALAGGQTVHGVPLVVDVTTLGRTDPAAAAAFVAGLLSPSGRAAFRSAGYQLLPPAVLGQVSAVPAVVRRALEG